MVGSQNGANQSVSKDVLDVTAAEKLNFRNIRTVEHVGQVEGSTKIHLHQKNPVGPRERKRNVPAEGAQGFCHAAAVHRRRPAPHLQLQGHVHQVLELRIAVVLLHSYGLSI